MSDKTITLEKAARKSIAAHLAGIKKAASDHMADMHAAVDKLHKAMGFEPDEEFEGEQPAEPRFTPRGPTRPSKRPTSPPPSSPASSRP